MPNGIEAGTYVVSEDGRMMSVVALSPPRSSSGRSLLLEPVASLPPGADVHALPGAPVVKRIGPAARRAAMAKPLLRATGTPRFRPPEIVAMEKAAKRRRQALARQVARLAGANS